MNAVIQKRNISETEYLELEEKSNIKHEYINGEMWAMAGASLAHNILTSNVSRHLGNHLDGTRCTAVSSDLKVKADHNFFYPDVVVLCSDENDEFYTDQPLILVEVLSKSTEKSDKSFKMTCYKTLSSLQEYVLISQDSAEIMVCRRNNSWAAEFFFLGDDVTFESIGLTLPVETIYQRVKNQDVLDYLQQKAQTTETETCL
ncbi:MAG: Uma2 family endonuclease [Methylococcales bacterium]|nr:Uma2 family endonuclease [Methylococcales bacterium]